VTVASYLEHRANRCVCVEGPNIKTSVHKTPGHVYRLWSTITRELLLQFPV